MQLAAAAAIAAAVAAAIGADAAFHAATVFIERRKVEVEEPDPETVRKDLQRLQMIKQKR